MSPQPSKYDRISDTVKVTLIPLLCLTFLWLLVCERYFTFHELSHLNAANANSDSIELQSPEKRSLQIASSEEADATVHILLCSDKYDRFAMYTLINSIIQNEPELERLYFHILVDENKQLFIDDVHQYFHRYFSLIRYEFRSIADDYPECVEYHRLASLTVPAKQQRNWLNNIMNFARFCAPNVFGNVDVGVYIDVDMVVQTRISKLYDEYYASHNYSAWSVLNRAPYVKTFGHHERAQYINDFVAHNLSTKYPMFSSTPIDFANVKHLFNAGILMFDFEIWRRHKFTQQSMELFQFNTMFAEHFHRRPWTGVTQPIFNMLFILNDIKVGDFGTKWNFVIKDLVHSNKCSRKISKSVRRTLEKQNILHWAGGCKPWNGNHVNTAYLWLKYIPENASISEWQAHFNITF